MTREEQIREASNELSKFHPGIKAWMDMAYEQGARWADNHPILAWKKPKDELPEDNYYVAVHTRRNEFFILRYDHSQFEFDGGSIPAEDVLLWSYLPKEPEGWWEDADIKKSPSSRLIPIDENDRHYSLEVCYPDGSDTQYFEMQVVENIAVNYRGAITYAFEKGNAEKIKETERDMRRVWTGVCDKPDWDWTEHVELSRYAKDGRDIYKVRFFSTFNYD